MAQNSTAATLLMKIGLVSVSGVIVNDTPESPGSESLAVRMRAKILRKVGTKAPTAATSSPAAQAPISPCTTVIGCVTTVTASRRDRICARHHTIADDGSCVSAAIDWLSSSSARATVTNSVQEAHWATCCGSSLSHASGQRDACIAARSASSWTQGLRTPRPPAGPEQRGQTPPRPEQQRLDAAGLQSERGPDFLV